MFKIMAGPPVVPDKLCLVYMDGSGMGDANYILKLLNSYAQNAPDQEIEVFVPVASSDSPFDKLRQLAGVTSYNPDQFVIEIPLANGRSKKYTIFCQTSDLEKRLNPGDKILAGPAVCGLLNKTAYEKVVDIAHRQFEHTPEGWQNSLVFLPEYNQSIADDLSDFFPEDGPLPVEIKSGFSEGKMIVNHQLLDMKSSGEDVRIEDLSDSLFSSTLLEDAGSHTTMDTQAYRKSHHMYMMHSRDTSFREQMSYVVQELCLNGDKPVTDLVVTGDSEKDFWKTGDFRANCEKQGIKLEITIFKKGEDVLTHCISPDQDKTLRLFILADGLPQADYHRLMCLSDPIMFCTGNGSISDALTLGKVPIHDGHPRSVRSSFQETILPKSSSRQEKLWSQVGQPFRGFKFKGKRRQFARDFALEVCQVSQSDSWGRVSEDLCSDQHDLMKHVVNKTRMDDVERQRESVA